MRRSDSSFLHVESGINAILISYIRKNIECEMQGMVMLEYEWNILEQYEIDVTDIRKIRGAFLCDSGQGFFLLKEVEASEKRIPALYELYEYLYNQGYTGIDRIVLNREGKCVTETDDGRRFLLKEWPAGRECDVRRPTELLAASGNLAKLHILMKHQMEHPVTAGMHLKEEYLRHNRELKKVRKFARGIAPKGEFEFAFLKYFDQMYQWADVAIRELEASGYEELYQESIESCCMTHGEYNYHNVLILRQGGHVAVTGFEKFKRDVQVEDLYYFLRKVMEKNGWKIRLGDNMMNAYSAIRPLEKEELEYLKIRLIYPEKFWKVVSTYYHSNKAWVPVKNVEKLTMAIRQNEEKKRFLEEIFAFHL